MEIFIDNVLINARRRRLGREYLYPLTVDRELDLMRFPQAFNVLVAVASQAKLNLVFGIQGKGVMNRRSATGPEGKFVEMLLLCEVRRKLDSIAPRSTDGAADCQPAGLRRRREISL